jgi:ATP synthase protein I
MVMIGGSGSGPTANPGRAVLVGAGLPAAVVGALSTVVGALDSGAAAASAAVGAGLAMVALAAGPSIMLVVKNWPPPAVMLAAMVGYAIAVGVVGLAYALLAPLPWMRGGYAGWSVLATMIAWIAAQIRTVTRLRFLAFGTGTEGDGGPGGPPRDGSPASPRQAPR